MRLEPDGAQLFPAVFSPSEVAALGEAVSLPSGRAGARLGPGASLAAQLGPADALAAALLGPEARAVGAKLFDKSPARNWALGWHQDRTVPVREPRDVPGFTHWTVKGGIAHCVPPFGILERSLTLRVHLDPVGADNAPLLIVPGSHRLGPVAEPLIPPAVERLGSRACLAGAGGVWVYSTPILHASERARIPARRRVIQLLYSAEDLPGGLRWRGI